MLRKPCSECPQNVCNEQDYPVTLVADDTHVVRHISMVVVLKSPLTFADFAFVCTMWQFSCRLCCHAHQSMLVCADVDVPE